MIIQIEKTSNKINIAGIDLPKSHKLVFNNFSLYCRGINSFSISKLNDMLSSKGSIQDVDPTQVRKIYSAIPESFYFIIMDSRQIRIVTDPYAIVKLYYYEDNQFIYFTDFYKDLIQFVKNLSVNINAIKYFFLRGYTPSRHSFFNEINKCPPSFIYSYSSNRLHSESYINLDNNFVIKSDELPIKIYEDLDFIYNHINSQSKSLNIFISGGLDSSVMLYGLNNINHDYQASIVKYEGLEAKNKIDNEYDLSYSKKISDELNFELNVFEYDFSDDDFTKYFDLLKSHLFNEYSISVALTNLIKNNPDDSIIVNGQNADSILSFGSTGSPFIQNFKIMGLGGVVKRYGHFFESHIFSPFYLFTRLLYALDTFKKFRKIPVNLGREDYLTGLFLHPKNEPFFHNDPVYSNIKDIKSLVKWVKVNYIDWVKTNYKAANKYQMSVLLYLNSYMQGTANRATVNPAIFFDKDIILPFTYLGILNKVLHSKPDWKYFFYGKYPNYVIANKYLKVPKYIIDRKDPINCGSSELIAKSLLNNKIFLEFINCELKIIDWNIFEMVFSKSYVNRIKKVTDIDENNFNIILKIIWVNSVVNEFSMA